jgi:RING-like zinc finger/PA domain
MRPTRLLLCLCFFSLTVVLSYSFWVAHAPGEAATSSSDNKKDYNSFFSWHMPSTLFPQSAIISLTDDNSTFFLSRPANYGPRLPTDGLSGQLWIGSGFSDDAILRGGASTNAEGELGCSDIPGWDPNQMTVAGSYGDNAAPILNDKDRTNAVSSPQGQSQPQNPVAQTPAELKSGPRPDDDGTDDYLHWPLKDTSLTQSGRSAKSLRQGRAEHADIQSLQETAEIAGKVVLLSRGGCGFLEKTKWVQRRGGVALVVGDNIRGGPLTTMYANGDASNISIPSVFTTRTTAHLLSSLIPPKNSDGAEDSAKGEQAGAKISQVSKEPSKAKAVPEKVQSPVSNATPKAANSKRSSSAPRLKKRSAATNVEPKRAKGWFTSVLSSLGWRSNDAKGFGADSSRPPSSGRLSWVVSENWDEDVGSSAKQQTQKDSKAKAKGASDAQKSPATDNFVIGVQDWRDPDMMKHDSSKEKAPNTVQQSKELAKGPQKDQKNDKGLSGGSHTPGSGVYHQSDNTPTSQDRVKAKVDAEEAHEKEGWFGRLFGGSSEEESDTSGTKAKAAYDKTVHSQYVKEKEFEEFADKSPVEHEGLWVTITPTTISTTPFFDTLLVLVVSPLVTLTVVYALLLLRSRIRRRRWRAPKSVVERLPVRTYHTMSYSSTSTSSQTTSPEASSPTSPLLRTNSRTMLSRNRPRSRTTSMLAEEVSSSLDKATAKVSLAKGERKRLRPKKYNGRQIECVVCLEEYVDGQSRVMSLPCGHEFHAECM